MAKAKEKIELKKGASEFELIGKALINKFTFKMDEKSKSSDWIYHRLNLGVDCGSGNVVYTEAMGGYGADRNNVVYVHGKKLKEGTTDKYVDDFKNRFTIAWEDRFDDKITSECGSRNFFRAGIEKDKDGKIFTKYFLSEYDLIHYLEENQELIKDKSIRVAGKVVYSTYNDNIQVKKQITSVFLSAVEESDFKATFKQTVLIDKYSIGKVDKETGLIPIDVKVVDYTKEYGGKLVKTNIPYNITMYVDNEKILKLLKVKKDITEVTLEGNIIEGQATAVVEYDDLEQDIKDLIDIGCYTLEDVAKTMAVRGDKVNQWIIKKPEIRMIGDDDNKVPQIQRTEERYTEDDLVLDFMIGAEDEDEIEKVVSDSNEDDMDWLKDLA